MQWKRRVVWLLFWSLSGLIVPLAGCSCNRSPPTAAAMRPFEGLVVRVACPADSPAAVVVQYRHAWERREGAQVEVVFYDPVAGPDKGPPADVWILAPAELPYHAAASRLKAVPATYTAPQGEYAWDSLLALYADKLLAWDGTKYALPLLGEAPLLFYRADLLDDPAHQAAFQQKYGRKLSPPATWEEFVDVAEFFNGNKEAGRTGPSLPPLPRDDDGLDRAFFAVAAPLARRAVPFDEATTSEAELFSFHYDLETMRPRIDTPGFVHALALLQRLQACRPPGAVAQPPEAFLQGAAVLCLAEASWIARFKEAPAIRGKYRVRSRPGSGSFFNFRTGARRLLPA